MSTKNLTVLRMDMYLEKYQERRALIYNASRTNLIVQKLTECKKKCGNSLSNTISYVM